MLGSALLRRLEADSYTEVITRARTELDLTDGPMVRAFFEEQRPEYVFLAAARVGGIQANDRYRAEFIHTNLAIQTTVIDTACRSGVERLLFFGSNCVYPKNCPQPMKEDYLHTGPLEPTSEAYAVAKIAGMAMCDAYNRQYGTRYLSLIPPTIFGPGDHFDSESAHVMSALIYRFHRARQDDQPDVEIWGSGSQRREFIYVDDLADACMFMMSVEDEALRQVAEGTGWVLNVGTGEDLRVLELASRIARVVGYDGDITTDPSRPDGAQRKLLDSTRVRQLGWSPQVSFEDGLQRTYDWYRKNGIKLAHALR